MYGTCLVEVMFINPKLISMRIVDDVVASIRQNLNMDFKQFFAVINTLEGFDSLAKR